jgi:hypothetical protein
MYFKLLDFNIIRICFRFELTVDPDHNVERIGAAVRRAKYGVKIFAKRRS